MRQCSKCLTVKTEEFFPKWKGISPKKASKCKDCHNEEQRIKRKNLSDEEKKKARDAVYRWRDKMKLSNPERLNGSREWAIANPERALFKRMQWIAKQRGIAVNLTYEEFLLEIGGRIPSTCPALGIELKPSVERFSDGSPSVDRIDSSRPYEIGNIAIISYRANMIKSIGNAD